MPNTYFHAWAVRDGDVAKVPEPTTLSIVALALLGLSSRRNKKLDK